MKFRREDIEGILDFLRDLLPENETLYRKLVAAGVKQHPDSALLHLNAADVEMTKPPSRRPSWMGGGGGPWAARRHLETALRLAEASTDPSVRSLLPQIQRGLGTLDDISSMFNQFAGAFGVPFGGGIPDFFDDEFEDDEFDDEGDDLDGVPFTLDGGSAPPPAAKGAASGSGPGKKQKKSKRRKK